MHGDEKLTAFIELELAIWRLRRIGLTVWRDFFQTRRRQADLEWGEGHLPR
jgi:hypothetical protein